MSEGAPELCTLHSNKSAHHDARPQLRTSTTTASNASKQTINQRIQYGLTLFGNDCLIPCCLAYSLRSIHSICGASGQFSIFLIFDFRFPHYFIIFTTERCSSYFIGLLITVQSKVCTSSKKKPLLRGEAGYFTKSPWRLASRGGHRRGG